MKGESMVGVNLSALSRWPTNLVNGRFTMIAAGLERRPPLCHGRTMESKNMRAGGCFWMVAILLGAFCGIAYGNPMAGVLLGTAAGGLLALAIYAVDRFRGRP
jgi:hypothetical protein